MSSSSANSASASKAVWREEEEDEEHSAFLKQSAMKMSSNPRDDKNTDNLRVKHSDTTILRKVRREKNKREKE